MTTQYFKTPLQLGISIVSVCSTQLSPGKSQQFHGFYAVLKLLKGQEI